MAARGAGAAGPLIRRRAAAEPRRRVLPLGRYIELAEPTFLIVEPRSTALILETSESRTFGEVLNKAVQSGGEKPASFAVISASAVKQRVIARLKRRGV